MSGLFRKQHRGGEAEPWERVVEDETGEGMGWGLWRVWSWGGA